ncbi:LuxR C-terminal-related transcriptional regulator [Burkholderia lata]|uniref:ATP-dependent transcriptional regulator, MalT-like, LuxR family n=1 Tax=Burkholderia lata (strain ATCC 17760 / DSM 23089 / LMG 22485 / NCIMB 9086 / R18194 / 383) TaxID=482957 RepID=Q396V4_BURL3|nr:LuxR C-terminal-related transcriptional regulator [Burkholderia lata]ABB11507.1 ATP-dependent transcriptional regulator, MalT-like, LuxR family [Burkholderia lata]
MLVADVTPARRPPSLVATKVLPPRLPAGLVDRPRLVELAETAESKRLTVIQAPAGFGKTSLARLWLDCLRTRGALAGWLSLDVGDDEPARFFHYFAQALQQACGDIGIAAGLSADASLLPPDAIVSTLINELVDVDDELYLFIDDYHLIGSPAIHAGVAYFIDHAPSQVHVVICTRTEPPLPLARLRAHNELMEIDAAELRFSFDETQSFVRRECPGTLADATVKSLFVSTEGWAAALRIAASVLKRGGAPGHDGAARIPSGASRPFAAYLEGMLERLPADLVDFMLRTSVLDRLSAPLCEAVTGVATSRPMLDTIVARQLLLQPLDQDGEWFRYHPLMAEYLRQRLATQCPDAIPDLHRRASRWYASQALWTDAVTHALAAGARDEAVALMAHCAMTLVMRGDLLTLLGWQRQFPADLMQGQVRVSLAIAWGMALAMRFDDALAMLDAIERTPGAGVDPADIRHECQAVRSVIAALQDDPRRAFALAQPCLDRPSTDTWTTNVVSNVVRFGHWKAGNLEALYATPWIPQSGDDRRLVFASVYRLSLLGHAEMQQMHFELAERYFSEAMQLGTRHCGPQSISVAICAPMLGQIRYEQGRLDEARALVIDLMPVIDVAVLLDSLLTAYKLLIRIAIARAEFPHAYALLDRAQALAHARGWPRLTAAVLVERTRLHIAEGRLTEAAACVMQFDRLAGGDRGAQVDTSLEIDTYRALVTACVATARNDLQGAVAALDDGLRCASLRHSDYLALRLKTVLALVQLRGGERAAALDTFAEVLEVAEPAGIYRSIVDQGPEIGELLQAMRDQARASSQTRDRLAYIERLLDGCRAQYQQDAQPARAAQRDMLSVRERDIVELIAHGQSNKEIARTLGIAPETVKSHIKSLFMKLEVDKRARAVAVAQSLGLLGTRRLDS